MKQRTTSSHFRAWHMICLSLLLLCVWQRSPAQDVAVKPGTDTVLINHLLADAAAVAHIDPDSSLKLYDKPLKLSLAGNYTEGAAQALKSIGRLYFGKSDYAQSINMFTEELAISKTPTQKATALYCIGNTYCVKGDYVQASTNFYSALKELQKNATITGKEAEQYIMVYSSLSKINSYIGQNSNTPEYLNKAETLARQWKMDRLLTVVLQDKSNYYLDNKQEGISYLMEALSISKKNNLKDRETAIDECLGSYYLESHQYEKAIFYFKAGRNLQNPNDEGAAYVDIYSSYCIGDALAHLKKYKEAENIIVPAIQRAQQLDMKNNMIEAYGSLLDIYKATGRYKKALSCTDTLNMLKDMLTGEAKTEAIHQMELKYKSAEKDKQLSQIQLVIAKQNEKIARKNVWIISISGGVLLLLLLGGGVYLQILHKQKSLEKENKIGILKAAVDGEDNERSRIARELHDGIGGMLSAAMMRFSSMHHENAAITNTVAYKDAMGIMYEMGDEIRKTAHNLMPEVLLKQSLPEALRDFCNNAQEDGKLAIDFQSYGTFDGLTQNYKLNLYRIAQELIKNVTTHAHATKVLVQLLQDDTKLILSIEDNGKGFNVAEVTGGLGLHNIRTRVSSMDGHFTLESKPGKGTTVIVEMELPGVTQANKNDEQIMPA